MIQIKRVYSGADKSDGTRILVDRLWPRGMSKEKAKVDLWLREAGPSDALRKWFGHDPKRWEGFRERYRREIAAKADCLEEIRDAEKKGPVTLIYAASDEEHNNAVALREILGDGARRGRSRRATS